MYHEAFSDQISVHHHLRRLVSVHGISLLEDVPRLEALLRDYYPGNSRGVFLLATALRQGVVKELSDNRGRLPHSILIGRLSDRLQRDMGLTAEAARWVVETWELALNGSIAPTRTEVCRGFWVKVSEYCQTYVVRFRTDGALQECTLFEPDNRWEGAWTITDEILNMAVGGWSLDIDLKSAFRDGIYSGFERTDKSEPHGRYKLVHVLYEPVDIHDGVWLKIGDDNTARLVSCTVEGMLHETELFDKSASWSWQQAEPWLGTWTISDDCLHANIGDYFLTILPSWTGIHNGTALLQGRAYAQYRLVHVPLHP